MWSGKGRGYTWSGKGRGYTWRIKGNLEHLLRTLLEPMLPSTRAHYGLNKFTEEDKLIGDAF
jgi:hypothetical protein